MRLREWDLNERHRWENIIDKLRLVENHIVQRSRATFRQISS